MPTLADHITKADKRPLVVSDMARFVDDEVGSKGGLSGFGIKAAYGLVKAIQPGFVPGVIDHMLDDWAARLEPLYAEATQKGTPLSQHLQSHAGAVADALLSVTDDRAKVTKHQSAKKAYEKLRPTARRQVEEAVPRLAALLEKHTKGS